MRNSVGILLCLLCLQSLRAEDTVLVVTAPAQADQPPQKVSVYAIEQDRLVERTSFKSGALLTGLLHDTVRNRLILAGGLANSQGYVGVIGLTGEFTVAAAKGPFSLNLGLVHGIPLNPAVCYTWKATAPQGPFQLYRVAVPDASGDLQVDTLPTTERPAGFTFYNQGSVCGSHVPVQVDRKTGAIKFYDGLETWDTGLMLPSVFLSSLSIKIDTYDWTAIASTEQVFALRLMDRGADTSTIFSYDRGSKRWGIKSIPGYASYIWANRMRICVTSVFGRKATRDLQLMPYALDQTWKVRVPVEGEIVGWEGGRAYFRCGISLFAASVGPQAADTTPFLIARDAILADARMVFVPVLK